MFESYNNILCCKMSKVTYTFYVSEDLLQKNTNISYKPCSNLYADYSIIHLHNTKPVYNAFTDSIPEITEEEAKYNSVIFECPSQNLLAMAPPATVSFNQVEPFLECIKEKNNVYISEFVEGTFIHLFYDPRLSIWEIATKRAIGGNYSYFHIPGQENLTYREMLMEAMQEDITADLNELPWIDSFSKEHSYSFVLQHPNNHIVIPIKTPKLYLVAVYKILSDEIAAEFVSPLEYETWDFLKTDKIQFPRKIECADGNYLSVIQREASIHTPCSQMGLMFLDVDTGIRCSFINPNYTELANIRGNYPNIHYQYLCLRRIGKVLDFLNYFPQYTSLFLEYRDQFEKFVTDTHQSYVDYYVLKKREFISKKYYSVIHNIHHTIYLPSIHNSTFHLLPSEYSTNVDCVVNGSKHKTIIRRSIVKQFIEQLHPGKLLYLLNYEKQYVIHKMMKNND